MDKVCVTIVTYNRKKYLCKLLEALDMSTYPIEMIIIVDNASSDETCLELVKQGIIHNYETEKVSLSEWKNKKVVYYLSKENTGGSGGFNKAFEIALNYEWKYIWAMDDDVWPEKDCLEKLISHLSNNVRACVPSRSDSKFEDSLTVGLDLKNPFKLGSKRKKILHKTPDMDYVEIVAMPFEGPIIERTLVEEVGLPNKDWFILYDDTEYAHKIGKISKIYYIPAAVLHKSIIKNSNKLKNITWRQYYYMRNAMKFDMKYGENIFVRKFSPWFYMITKCLIEIVHGGHENINIIRKAYVDAKHDNMGMTVRPGEF